MIQTFEVLNVVVSMAESIKIVCPIPTSVSQECWQQAIVSTCAVAIHHNYLNNIHYN